MPAKRKDLPEGGFQLLTHGLLKSDPKKVRCPACQEHIFGASPFQRKSVKKHINSQAHRRAIRAAAEAKEEESAALIRVRRLDAQAVAAEK